ncbi:beta-ketoacyl synthase N-terminal-like domain-containing protein [Candidatus Omnitrophota bacterium]
MKKRVVITGIGPLSSIGEGKDLFWSNLIKAKTKVRLKKLIFDNDPPYQFYLHKVTNFKISNFKISNDKLDEISQWKDNNEVRDLFYFIATIKLALDDSKLCYNKKSRNIGLILAHENPGLGEFYNAFIKGSYDILSNKKNKLSQKDFLNLIFNKFGKQAYDLQTFMYIYHVSKVFDLRGFSLFINNACASGLYAIETASSLIKSGRCDAVIISAVDYPDIFKYLWFKRINMYSEDGKIRPFSEFSNGLVFGDGGASIVVEDLQHALNRKAHVYAEYSGGGFNLEGWKVSLPDIKGDSFKESFFAALEQSKIKLKDIDLINVHGVGTKILDMHEARNLIDIYSKTNNMPPVMAFKPYFGHNLGGSALLEVCALCLCLKNNLAIPILNCETPIHKTRINYCLSKKKLRLRTAIKTCSAFAGFNGAAVFRKIN